jgi:hypothetical protein
MWWRSAAAACAVNAAISGTTSTVRIFFCTVISIVKSEALGTLGFSRNKSADALANLHTVTSASFVGNGLVSGATVKRARQLLRRSEYRAASLALGANASAAAGQSGEPKIARRVRASRLHKEISMRTTILTAATLVLFSSAVMAQSTDTKSPATTGPAAQSDSMSKGDMSKMSKKKMVKSKSSTKMKKTDDKM